MITEKHYQELLEPFKSANIMFPGTLEKFYLFTRNDPDPDATDFDQMLHIMKWLLAINETMYPGECEGIRNKIKRQITTICTCSVCQSHT